MKEISPPLICIAGSAGSHGPLAEFLQGLPDELQCALVVIQHLDASHDSILPDILQKSTGRQVRWMVDDLVPQTNEVYVLPPAKSAVLKEGRFVLEDRPTDTTVSNVIDTFAMSMVGYPGHRALIILSGAGSDGSRAGRILRNSGGLLVVQDPSTAAHSKMPENAIAISDPDLVMKPALMGPAIARYLLSSQMKHSEAEWEAALQRIFSLLVRQSDTDFQGYKPGTLRRRLERKLGILQLDLPEYLDLLETEDSELIALRDDFLIGVSSFFRDPEVFHFLRSKVFPELVASATSGLRLWVPGCATGEEAYSLAMQIAETMDEMGRKLDVQIFATDIAPRALERARDGLYTASIAADVSAQRLSRFFHAEGQGYRIKQSLRDMVIFSRHNLLKDPPFSRIDLLSCRNLLIYLNRETQKQALQAFHYSLRDNGFLLLGKSESVAESEEFFGTYDGANHLFTRIPGTRFRRLRGGWHGAGQKTEAREKPSLARIAEKAALRRFIPPSVLINPKNQILYVQGRTGAFLELPSGETSNELLALAKPGLKAPLSGVLRQARQSGREAIASNIVFGDDVDSQTLLEIVAQPLNQEPGGENLMLVAFLERARREDHRDSAENSSQEAQLKSELYRLRENLENTIHELEQTNEELRISNESAESANEELQSANEELETSREELESLNEELLTTNAELEHKIEALDRANNHTHNLMRSTHLPVIFLDSEGRITWFSDEMTGLISLQESDKGQSVHRLQNVFPELDWYAEQELVRLKSDPLEKTLEARDGRTFLLRAFPYTRVEGGEEGTVFTFFDITRRRQQEKELEAHRNHLEQLVQERTQELQQSRQLLEQSGQVARVGGWQMDMQTRALSWTDVTYDILELDRESELNFDRLMDYFAPQEKKRISSLFSMAITHGEPYDVEVPLTTARGNRRWIAASGRPVFEAGRCVRMYGSIQDITDRKKMEEKLQHTTDLLMRTEHVAGLGSWEWDLQTGEVVWSDELFNIFGVPPEQGSPSIAAQDSLFTPESSQRIERALERAIQKAMPYFIEVEGVRKDGKHIFGIATGLPLKNEKGEVVRLYGSFQDITQRAIAQKEAIQAKEEAEKANRAKTIFLGNLSHELRTPMNAIIGMTELALEEEVPREIESYLRTVLDASDHLMSIISDLLDAAVMEQGKLELERHPFSIREAIDKAASIVDKAMEQKGLEFRRFLSKELPETVVGDAKRLRQVLINVLNNAAKYTKQGGVELDASCSQNASNDGTCILNIAISDTGPGIPEADQQSVFEKFTQSGSSSSRLLKRSAGTGMGLYIARSIVDSMGGHIALQSNVGKGSTFLISVPLSLPTEVLATNDAKGNAPASLSRMSILMAEDNAINALVQRTVLEQANHTVALASNGEEVLDLLRKDDYDLILMDLEMPVLDGFETTIAIRSGTCGEKKKGLPIIAVTAHVLSEVEEHCWKAGMDGFVKKPIDVRELQASLEQILQDKRNRQEASI
ncbi:MAG: response regulator [Leptospiraceae bacterium]|nr:response regulator [Leptospiraceae bacterium]